MIHLGLKVTEATLDRTLDVVRLADTLLVASAVPTERGATSQEPVWPEEEQADLDALSATLRARKEPETTGADEAEDAPPRKATTRQAPAKKTARTTSATATSSAKKAPAKKSAAKKSAAKKSAAKKAPAKKSAAKKAPAKKSASSGSSPDA
ncbi:hypothetical protein [Janibacter sp. DB-40]|uniref:hypothetical protein n=1 Tax=Janibacter sp. DB-40 TaxID=3028808 RepID=UPI0024058B59|nr:hypothetical protein [Janibacter sp. DB-40]